MNQEFFQEMRAQMNPSDRAMKNLEERLQVLRSQNSKRHITRIAAFSITAAAAVMICATAILSLGNTSASLPIDISNDSQDTSNLPASSVASSEFYDTLQHALQSAVINKLGEEVGSSRLYFDPELTYEEIWGQEQITEYLGKEIAPDYTAPNLLPSEQNGTARVIKSNDGKILYDSIWLEYYDPDGGQVIGQGSIGIRIIASKIGMLSCAVYVWPEDMEPTEIDGISVKIGHRRMDVSYIEDHSTGYYDVYVAEFEKDGISFQATSTNLNFEEFCAMVTSLILK